MPECKIDTLLDRYRGCMLGGAVGDALGYTVEFMDEGEIRARYGEGGIAAYTLVGGTAQISDDTQMTLFTADGLLSGAARGLDGDTPEDHAAPIAAAYGDWWRTQNERYPLRGGVTHSRLIHVPALFADRAPGGTCLSALAAYHRGVRGTVASPINSSKGCGGVMRVAPIGLFYRDRAVTEVDRIAAEAAAVTHGHDLGYLPAAGLVHIIHLVTHGGASLSDAVRDMITTVPRLFPGAKHGEDYTALMKKAVALAEGDTPTVTAIHALGEGWVGEEALAIAVYCALKYEKDFKGAIVAAVNHNGDSDSTGAITGNILGACRGLAAIPSPYLDRLELKELLLELADDLCAAGHTSDDGAWMPKYKSKI